MIHLIAAVSENRVIGKEGKIPWHIPEDLKRFRNLTLNHPVIMGRKTYQSILDRLGHPLPERINIVLSRNSNFTPYHPRVFVERNKESAIERAKFYDKNIFVIGGEQVYKEFLEDVKMMHITNIYSRYEGDAFFPEIKEDKWVVIRREDREEYSFLDYIRRRFENG